MNNFRHHPFKVYCQDVYLAQDSQLNHPKQSHNQVEDTCKEYAYPLQSSKSKPRYSKPIHPSSSDSESDYEETPTDPPLPPFLTPPPEVDLSQEVDLEENATTSSPRSSTDPIDHDDTTDKKTINLVQPVYGSADYLRPNDINVLVKDGFWQRAKLSSHVLDIKIH